MIPGSSHLEPVNWRGDGQELRCYPATCARGMIDGELRRVVMFPDDGHPDLASAVRDVTGDQRDEIVPLGSASGLDLHAGPILQRLANFARCTIRITTIRTTGRRYRSRLGRHRGRQGQGARHRMTRFR